MWRSALAIAYLSSALLTPPCLGAERSAPKQKKESHEITLNEFIEKLQSDGEVTQLPTVFIKLMGFSLDSTQKTFDASPVALFWTNRIKADRRSESYDYRTTLIARQGNKPLKFGASVV